MCNYSVKLIAWLDGELKIDEMADVQRHVGECIECRKQLAAYEQMSAAFNAYYDAVVAVKMRRSGLLRWVPAMSALGAAAIAAVLVLALTRVSVGPPVLPLSVKAPTPPAIALETKQAPVKAIHRRHTTAPVARQTVNWPPAQRAIQICIPAESMFPPGAVPEGISFLAEMSIAADGSAEQIRLRPRLIGFERRATQP